MKTIYITLIILILCGCDNSDCNYMSAKSFVKKRYAIEISTYIQENIEDFKIYNCRIEKYASSFICAINTTKFTLENTHKSDQSADGELITCKGLLMATYEGKSVSFPIKYHIEKYSTLNVWLGKLSPNEIHTLLKVITQRTDENPSR